MGIETLAAIGLAFAGTAASVYGQVQAGKAAKDAQIARARQEEIRAAQQRTQQIRQSRIKRAQIEQAAASSGAESSSATTGASGVTSAGFSNIQYINDQVSIGKSASAAEQRGIDAQGISNLGSGVAALGGSVFNQRAEIQDIFS